MSVDRYNIIEAMQRSLWKIAYAVYAQDAGLPRDVGTATPSQMKKVVADLAKLYSELNDGESLVDMYERWQTQMLDEERNGRDPEAALDTGPRHFGRLVAFAALGIMRQAIFENMFKVPSFTIEYDGETGVMTWEGGETRNPRAPHDVPHTKTVAEVRRILAKVDRCDSKCPGWGIFNEQEGRPSLQVCDECMTSLNAALRLSDDDVAQLPEAKKALAEAVARVGALEDNPGGLYRVEFYSDYEWQNVGVFEASSKDDAIAKAKSAARKTGWSMPAGTKWRTAPSRNPPPVIGDRVATKHGTGILKSLYESKNVRGQILATVVDETDGEEIRNVPVSDLTRVGCGRPPGVPNGSR